METLRQKPICCVLEKQADGIDNQKNNNSGSRRNGVNKWRRDNCRGRTFSLSLKFPPFSTFSSQIERGMGRPKLLKVKEHTSITASVFLASNKEKCGARLLLLLLLLCVCGAEQEGARTRDPSFIRWNIKQLAGRVSSIERIFFSYSFSIRSIYRKTRETDHPFNLRVVQ